MLYEVASLEKYKDDIALIWCGKPYSYEWLIQAIEEKIFYLKQNQVKSGDVVALVADFSPNAVAFLLALVNMGAIIIPIATSVAAKQEEYLTIGEVATCISIATETDDFSLLKRDSATQHDLLLSLKDSGSPGIVLFSSGSTGASKAAVHNFDLLVKKFNKSRHKVRGVAFLLFDHIGGLNTLLYSLFNGGCLIVPGERSPQAICEAIHNFRAEALTTTPTFLNLLLLSGVYQNYDFSSLKWINYSTEVMPQHTLQELNRLFPHVRFSQAYGLSEVGVLSTQTKSSNSSLIKLTSEGYSVRIHEGLLEIKSNTSMLGYLNAPNPFTEDGWFKTGDAVETEGEYIKILGRKSEMINVGGQKVYPAEVENVIQSMPSVEDVIVTAEPNLITGQMVKAAVRISSQETLAEFRQRLRSFCQEKLPAYKIPQKIIFLEKQSYSERFKKMRSQI